MSIFSIFKKKTVYPIEVNTTHASVEVLSDTVKEGSSLSLPVTPDAGYAIHSVIVVMNNVRLRSTYKDGNIVIPSVEGPIRITVKSVPESETFPRLKFASRLQK